MGTADNIQQTVLLVTKRQEIPPSMSAMMSLFHAVLKAFGYSNEGGFSDILAHGFQSSFPQCSIAVPSTQVPLPFEEMIS